MSFQAVLGHVHLETTTIYVKVAQQRTSFPSPLDRLAEEAASAESPHAASASRQQAATAQTQPAKPSVGSLRIHSRLAPIDPNSPQQAAQQRTQITLELRGNGYREFLTGTIAEIPRPGYVTLTLPPLEAWSQTIAKLPANVRQRISEPEFYQILQTAITRRMLHPPPASR